MGKLHRRVPSATSEPILRMGADSRLDGGRGNSLTDLDPRRAFNVGGSEVASLFGAGRQTRFELYLEKRGELPQTKRSKKMEESLEVGRAIECTVADLLQSRIGLTGQQLRNVYRYMEHRTVTHSGCSLDHEITGVDGWELTLPGSEKVIDPTGPGICEIKNVSDYAWRAPSESGYGWEKGAWIPFSIQLQLQQQLSVAGRDWGILACLVGGNHLHAFPVWRHNGVQERIEKEIPLFWSQVENGKAPPIDWEQDARVVIAMRRLADEGVVIDLSENQEANDLAFIFDGWRRKEAEAKKEKEKYKAMLLKDHVKTAEWAELANGGSISAKSSPRAGYTVEAKDSVRTFRVNIKEVSKDD